LNQRRSRFEVLPVFGRKARSPEPTIGVEDASDLEPYRKTFALWAAHFVRVASHSRRHDPGRHLGMPFPQDEAVTIDLGQGRLWLASSRSSAVASK
jgi:hypothetical protein